MNYGSPRPINLLKEAPVDIWYHKDKSDLFGFTDPSQGAILDGATQKNFFHSLPCNYYNSPIYIYVYFLYILD